MKQFIESMNLIAYDMEEMNNGCKKALTFIREINEISQINIDFISNIGLSIRQQRDFAGQLEKEAVVLQKNMNELESAITAFRLE